MQDSKDYNDWVKFAKRDLESAEVLFESELFDNCASSCHQAIEKIFKSFIVFNGKLPQRTHDIYMLCSILSKEHHPNNT